MRRFEKIIDLRLLERFQHDEAIRVRLVDDEVAHAIRMFVEADLGHARGWRGKYVVGHFKMVPAWWHEVWWARFLRWFYRKWHGVIGRLPAKARSWLVRRRIALIAVLKQVGFAEVPVIETRVYPIPDFDTLVERIIFQAADLHRRGEIPRCVVMGPETHYQLMGEEMRQNTSLYFGVSADFASVFLHTAPQTVIGLKIHLSPFMAPGAVVVVGE